MMTRFAFLFSLAACAGNLPGGHGDDSSNPDSGSGKGDSGGGGDGTTEHPTGRISINGPNLVDENGGTVRLTGINWFGLETNTYAPHGLWARSMDSMLDQIKTLGFNCIRVPFSSQLFDAGSTPNGIDFTMNPDLVAKSGPEILDILITKASARKLRIILDRHRPDSGAQSELWYTPQYDETRWIHDWVMLATKYKDNPMVVAFDLHNEPHKTATWGDGNLATDWRLAAQRAGNAILAVDAQALILVEGVEIVNNNYYWWGGNLRNAAASPVQLSQPNHVIYSPHEYPASIFMQTWFSDPTFPANMPGVWGPTWGDVSAMAPVLIGEFGTKLQIDLDRKWLSSLAAYIKQRNLSFTFWSLNPDSGDTGGILGDDWMTVNTDKMSYLTPILAPQ